MDELGVDMHLMALTAPGVQMFDADTAHELAMLANDRLAALCHKYPTRFAGLASFAPHSPKRAAKEMERAIGELGLNGFMINSHTHGEYLDDPKFWPILEAAEALDRCIYIHPRAASDTLKGPLQDYGMDSAMWGYGVEVGTHAVRMMAGGVFDQFPNLKIIIGHMGEGLPFSLWRIDYTFRRAGNASIDFRSLFTEHFWITTSGNFSTPALICSMLEMGSDHIMYSVDYPFVDNPPGTEWMRDVQISAEDKAKILSGNAKRLLKLK